MRKFVILCTIGILALAPHASRAEPKAPEPFVQRAEAVMTLLRNAGISVDMEASVNGRYPDMIDGQWYVPYMLAGLERGIVAADTSGYTYPQHAISRGEFLRMMTNTFKLTTHIPHQYKDVDKSDPISAYAGLSWRYRLFYNPDSPHVLQPNVRMKHAEATKAIYTLFRHEPDLRPSSDIVIAKVAGKTTETVQRSFFAGLNTTLQKTTEAILNTVTPVTVKSAMRSLILSRENLAEKTRNELIDAVNVVRAEYKLQPLKSNYYLERSAQKHSKDMAERGYFSHYTPEGLSYVERIRRAGYLDIQPGSCSCANGSVNDHAPGYVTATNKTCTCEPSYSLGENLAKGQLSVQEVMEDWMHSPNHRKNILRPEFEEIGIGLFGDVWTQNFGRLTFE